MQKRRKLGRGVAVVGAGMSKFGMFADKDSRDLLVEAYNEMVSSVDKGIDPKDIDAMWMGNFSNDFYVDQGHMGPIVADILARRLALASKGLEMSPIKILPLASTVCKTALSKLLIASTVAGTAFLILTRASIV